MLLRITKSSEDSEQVIRKRIINAKKFKVRLLRNVFRKDHGDYLIYLFRGS